MQMQLRSSAPKRGRLGVAIPDATEVVEYHRMLESSLPGGMKGSQLTSQEEDLGLGTGKKARLRCIIRHQHNL